MKTVKMSVILALVMGLIICQVKVSKTAEINTAFTYQGRLIDANKPADGLYDFQFKLYDAATNGNQWGGTIDVNELDVIDGYFTVELDFGNVFDGHRRWLEIGVRPGELEDPNEYTVLSLRQELTPTPYAIGLKVPANLNGSSSDPIIKATNIGSGKALYGKHDASGNYGYLGSSNYGVYGYSESGIGVTGGSTNNDGIYGGSINGRGVHGVSAYVEGVYGENVTTGNYGSLGTSLEGVFGSSSAGNGVYGASSSGHGVYGSSSTGHAIHGYNSSGNYGFLGDPNYGVYGENKNGNFGYLGSSLYGVYGECKHNLGAGVYGYAPNIFSNGVEGVGGTGVFGSGYDEGVVGVGDVTGVEGSGDSYDFYANGPGVDYGSPSSIRWKRNIQHIDKPLEKILQLRGVYFDWDPEHGGGHDIGMIAEEVGRVLPEIVQYEEDGIYASGMDYGKLTPLLVEAIKALKTEIDQLQKENADLRKQIEAIVAQVGTVQKGEIK